MFRNKIISILTTPLPLFSSAPAKEEEFEPAPYSYRPRPMPVAPEPEPEPTPELEPMPEPEPMPEVWYPTVIQAPRVIPIDDAQAPVLSQAEKELEVAKNSLQAMKEALAEAKAEAKVLDAVHETNQLVRQLAIEMGEQLLLPSQLEERRKAASADNESIAEMLKDLGF